MENSFKRKFDIERFLLLFFLVMGGLGCLHGCTLSLDSSVGEVEGIVGAAGSGIFVYLVVVMGALLLQSARMAQRSGRAALAQAGDVEWLERTSFERARAVGVDIVFGGALLAGGPILAMVLAGFLLPPLALPIVVVTGMVGLGLPIYPFWYLCGEKERWSQVAGPACLGVLAVMVVMVLLGVLIAVEGHLPDVWWAGRAMTAVFWGVGLGIVLVVGFWMDRLFAFGVRRTGSIIGYLTLPLMVYLVVLPNLFAVPTSGITPSDRLPDGMVFCTSGMEQEDPVREHVEGRIERFKAFFIP